VTRKGDATSQGRYSGLKLYRGGEPVVVDNSRDSILVETKNLSKRFGGLLAVSDLFFRVEPGEIRGVIGPNGAGKTTLFNLISGCMKPTSGQVFFKGENITGRPPHVIAKKGIARKFQVTQVFGSLSLTDNIRLALQRTATRSMLGLFIPRPLDRQIQTILEKVHLTDKCALPAASLSHGERQCLELGIVFATGAELLLLDEPTAGMSIEERAEMAELIKEIARETTIVITEHDFDFIKEVATLVTVLNKGKKLAEGPVEEIEGNEEVRECYLGRDDVED